MTDTNGVIFGRITDLYNRDCNCLNLSYQLQKSYVFSWKLEKNFTQTQCLNLYLKKTDYLYNNRGIFNASKYYFKKPINELSFNENITLVLMTKNPKQYNPKSNPEELKRAIEKVKIKLNKIK